MKLGLLSAILPDSSFEEVIDIAKHNNYNAVELACWPKGKSLRRYAGVTHIDVDNLDNSQIKHILDYTRANGIEISALGYYPNALDPNEETAAVSRNHIIKVIKAASKLGVNRVSTFIGKNPNLNDEDNFELFKKYWPTIIKTAEELDVYVGIENCPMYFTKDEWPGGKNLASSPYNWRKMFEIIPSKHFGLSYDPSHIFFQRMDYIKPLIEFKERIFHIHLKDIQIDQSKIDEYGIFTYPLNYMTPKIPGEGGIDWQLFIKTLKETEYNNCACVEIEDKKYESNFDSILEAIKKSNDNVKNFF